MPDYSRYQGRAGLGIECKRHATRGPLDTLTVGTGRHSVVRPTLYRPPYAKQGCEGEADLRICLLGHLSNFVRDPSANLHIVKIGVSRGISTGVYPCLRLRPLSARHADQGQRVQGAPSIAATHKGLNATGKPPHLQGMTARWLSHNRDLGRIPMTARTIFTKNFALPTRR